MNILSYMCVFNNGRKLSKMLGMIVGNDKDCYIENFTHKKNPPQKTKKKTKNQKPRSLNIEYKVYLALLVCLTLLVLLHCVYLGLLIVSSVSCLTRNKGDLLWDMLVFSPLVG